MRVLQNLTIILISLLSVSVCIAQNKKQEVFFNEFLISGNYSTVEDRNTSNDFGWGLGTYRRGFDSSRVNMVFGFEFCQTRQHKDQILSGKRSTGYDVGVTINYIRMPLAARFNFLQEGIFFSELGASLAIPLGATMDGEFRGHTPDGKTTSGTLNDSYRPPFNFGGLISLGSRIPLQKLDLLFKANYTYDLRSHNSNDGGAENNKIYNRYFSISAGIALH